MFIVMRLIDKRELLILDNLVLTCFFSPIKQAIRFFNKIVPIALLILLDTATDGDFHFFVFVSILNSLPDSITGFIGGG